MHRLIVNPGTTNAWETPLAPGVCSLGRSKENTVALDHPSVAERHCLITVSSGGALIKDLGSGATFVDDSPVNEAVLLPGQTVRLGDVLLRFETSPEPPPPITLPVNAPCRIHPRTFARFICPNCEGTFCDLCVSTRPVEGRPTAFCRACSVECTPLPPPGMEEPEPASFMQEVGAAFTYPLRGDGKVVLLAGTMVIWILDLLSRFSGIFSIFIALFMFGFLICHLEQILASSAVGEDEVPDLPDLSSLDDIASPLLQFLGPFVVCFGPAIALGILGAERVIDREWLVTGAPAAALLGCAVFPMAFLAVTVFRSLGALNPLLLIRSILKIPLEYLLVVLLLACGLGLLFVVMAAVTFGGALMARYLPIPFLPTIVAGCTMIYFLSVDMRILGMLYWTRRQKLNWVE